jgi:hypothetical protein
MIHKHRIIPGYGGGEYVEGNVVSLTLTQHVMWHYAEWARKKNIQDLVAYKFLSGQLSGGEANELLVKEGARKGGEATKKKGTGICDPAIAARGRKKVHESGQPRQLGLNQGRKNVESGHLEKARQIRPLNKELFRCLVTGKVTYPGPLTTYQRSRGIDTSLREKVYD